MYTIENNRCVFCGKGVMRRKIKKVEYEYRGIIKQIDQSGMYCSFCNESILEAKDLEFNKFELMSMKIYWSVLNEINK